MDFLIKTSLLIAILLGSILAFAVGSALPASAADGGPTTPPSPPLLQAHGAGIPAAGTSSKLSGAIQSVVAAAQSTAPGAGFTNGATGDYGGASPLFAAGLVRETSVGMVQVYIHVDDEINDGLRAALRALGTDIEMESAEQGIVQASVPYGILVALGNVGGVKVVTEPSYGVVNVGNNLSQGDTLLNYDDLRTIQGVDGTGVTVGVISGGILGLADAIAAGDLPATTQTRPGGILTGTSGGVIATSFRADGDLEKFGSSPNGEGTAMLEIIHDIAPGAQLRFANFSTSLEFNAAVNFLASVSDVVVDDIGFFARPTDGTSDVSTNTAAARNNSAYPIRAYVTSVGNSATSHYEGAFVGGADGAGLTGTTGALHVFGASSTTSDALSLGSQVANPIFLAPGQTGVIYLTWDDYFVSATSDFGIYVTQNSTGDLVCCFNFNNDSSNGGDGLPWEVAVFTNSSASGLWFDVFVQNTQNVSSAHTLEMFMVAGGVPLSNGALFNFNTAAGSVGAQSDAGGGVISVGAINASDSGTDTIATYSSQGPTGDGRMKPDITAVDGVDVSGAGGFSDPFYGTSAAAPHVAGLAALLLEFRPDLKAGNAGDDPTADRSTLRDAILNGGVDLGATGPDQVFGYGRADGLASAAELFAAPVFDAAGGLVLVEGATRTPDGLSFTDLNLSDAHTITVDWGDGATSSGPATDAQTNGIDWLPQSAVPAVYDPTVFDVQSTGTIYTVNTANDVNDGTCDGTHCSLREAIIAANGNSGTDSIHFNIPGGGPHTILIVGTALPPITSAVVIDGYTQAGASPNTNALSLGLNTVIKVSVKSGLSAITGLDIQSGVSSVIRGLAIQRFATAIRLPSVGSHVIEGNFLGTSADGVTGLGNNTAVVVQAGGSNSTIGGANVASANLISANEVYGVSIDQVAGVVVQNNLIGLDITGLVNLSNANTAILITDSSGVQVTDNFIKSTWQDGIALVSSSGGNLSNNHISGALWPVIVSGTSTSVNVSGNTITGNRYGVGVVDQSTGVSIIGNSISGQDFLGIDLSAAGPSLNEPNDNLDADSGPNNMMNYPVITGKTASDVEGTINTEASSVVRIELFANTACDPSGFGEGETFIGVATVTTDASGNAAFSIPFAVPGGAILTSTATLALSTSHFSACWVAPALPYYTDDGVFTARATVTDDDGLSDAVSFTVTVSNAPPIPDAGAPLVLFEGAALTHSGSFTDAGAADTHTALVDWGDATVATATVDQGARTSSATHTFGDDGVLTLTLTITDDDGGVGTDTTTITVLNATPVVDAVASKTARATITVDVILATFTDDGLLDTHTALIDWGDGTPTSTGTVDQNAGTVGGSHVYASDGAYSVSITVTDDDGGVASDVLSITVTSGPLVTAAPAFSVVEGATVSYDASFSDLPQVSTHTADLTWGSTGAASATVDQTADTLSATLTFDDDAVVTLMVTITSGDGLVGTGTTTITVLNATPVVDAVASKVVRASDTIDTVLATFTDVGLLDTHTAKVDWGDGTVLATGTVDQGARSVSASHVYDIEGNYTVTITVTDDDGGVGSTALLVVVQDAPLVDVGIDLTVDEGSSLLLAFSFIDSASETHDATVGWGDGASTTGTVNQSLDTVSASHIYVDQGVFVVQASVSDDTGLSGLDTLSVTVANVAPVVIAATGLVRPDLPTPAFTLATFTDSGASDTHTAVIDWGDGTVESGTVSDGSVSGAHLLVGLGAHFVTVTVTDSDGASTSVVAQVTVFNAPPVPGITGWVWC